MTPDALLLYAAIFVIACGLSFGLTLLYRHYALRRGVIDTPNARSSHSQPTPRGGGISIILVFCGLFTLAWLNQWLSPDAWQALMLGGLLVAGIGLLDDHRPVPSALRFGVHLAAALLALLSLKTLPALPVAGWSLPLGGPGLVLLAIALTWLINLYNFMDGIDGIAGIEAASVLLGGALILLTQGNTADAHNSQLTALLILLCAPLLGFLLLNWAPAKIFMGDGCSGFLGIVLGLLAVILASHTALNLWCWVILLGAFIVDASWTLATRMVTGQRWHSPHRSHCYQILSRRCGSHSKVSAATGLLNLLWLAPWAWLASRWPELGLAFAAMAFAPLLLLCAHFGAGRHND